MKNRVALMVLLFLMLIGPSRLAAQAGDRTVTFGILAWSPLFYVPMVGISKGHFARHGIKVEVVFTAGAGPAIQALLGGSLNFAATTPAAAFAAQEKVPDMQQVISALERSPYVVMSRPEIAVIGDLKGRVIGATGVVAGADTEMLRLFLKTHGLESQRDYSIVAIGSVTARSQALLNNTISAVAQMEPYISALTDKGMRPLARAADDPNFGLILNTVVVAMRPWYRANEDTAVRFLRGWADATGWLYDPANRDEATRILQAQMKLEDRYAEATYRLYVEQMKVYSNPGRIAPRALEQAAQNMRALGEKMPPANLGATFDNSLWEKALPGKQ